MRPVERLDLRDVCLEEIGVGGGGRFRGLSPAADRGGEEREKKSGLQTDAQARRPRWFAISHSLHRSLVISELDWLDAPPAEAVALAESLLNQIGAKDEMAERMSRFPLIPRLSRIVVAAIDGGVGEDGCRVAALLSLGERSESMISSKHWTVPGAADLLARRALEWASSSLWRRNYSSKEWMRRYPRHQLPERP